MASTKTENTINIKCQYELAIDHFTMEFLIIVNIIHCTSLRNFHLTQ